jgi:restriction system protein
MIHPKPMTYLEAAYHILTQASAPLHYVEITRRALAQGLITPTGETPEATMGSRLYTDTLDEASRFARNGRGRFELVQWQPSGIDQQVQQINENTRSQLRERLHTMSPERFEALITELLIQMGFAENTVTVTPYRNDGGIDVVGVYRAAGLTEVNAAVQVKRWKRNVQAPTVTQLRGSLQVHQQGIIITTSDFSSGARVEASAPNKTRIGLINGVELLDLLIKHKVGVVEKSLKVISLDDEWWGELLATEATPVDDPIALSTASEPVIDDAWEADPSMPTGHKPTGFMLFGQTHPADSWKSILVQVCTILVKQQNAGFATRATTLQGRKRHYIATSPDAMINPAPIGGSDLWVETNLSARDTIKLVERLLVLLGYGTTDLKVHW